MSGHETSRTRDRRLIARGLMLGAAALALAVPAQADGPVYVDDLWTLTPDLERTATNVGDFGGGRVIDSMLFGIDPKFVGGGYLSGLATSGIGSVPFANGNGMIVPYGQLNIVYTDIDNENPVSDNSYFATNAAGRSHLGLGGQYDFSKAWAVGARAAFAFDFNRTDINNDFAEDAGCDERDANRRTFCVWDANLYIQHETLGRITVGYGETAFSGIGSVNLGGTAFVTNNDPTIAVGFHEVFFTGFHFGEIAPDVTGVERGPAIRYDSPTFAGFALSGSWGEADHVAAPFESDDYWDVALRYAGEFSGFRVAAGVGYQDYDRDTPDFEQSNITGSASVLHVPTGLYLSGSGSWLERDAPGSPGAGESDDADSYYGQAGIGQKWFGIGKTTLYGEYGASDGGADSGDFFLEDSETSSWGAGVVQEIDAAAMALYLAYRNVDAEIGGVEGEEIDVITGGARIKF